MFEFSRYLLHHCQLQLMFLNSITGRKDLSASLSLQTFRFMWLSQSYLNYTLYSILIYHYRLDKIQVGILNADLQILPQIFRQISRENFLFLSLFFTSLLKRMQHLFICIFFLTLFLLSFALPGSLLRTLVFPILMTQFIKLSRCQPLVRMKFGHFFT